MLPFLYSECHSSQVVFWPNLGRVSSNISSQESSLFYAFLLAFISFSQPSQVRFGMPK